MTHSSGYFWLLIVLIGLGTYLIRFSFIGLIGNHKLPNWLLRHLRYTPVAVLPGLVAPLILWPGATQGHMDAPRLMAAAATVAVGVWSKNILASIFAGAGTLYLALYLLGG